MSSNYGSLILRPVTYSLIYDAFYSSSAFPALALFRLITVYKFVVFKSDAVSACINYSGTRF